jgi:hypothetical protein
VTWRWRKAMMRSIISSAGMPKDDAWIKHCHREGGSSRRSAVVRARSKVS